SLQPPLPPRPTLFPYTTLFRSPEGSVRPVRYAVKMPTTTQNANHCTRYFGIFAGPPGNTVIIPTGPCLNFSCISGDFMSLCVQCGNIYTPRLTPDERSAARTLSSSGSFL